jgi:hypothetical protein
MITVRDLEQQIRNFINNPRKQRREKLEELKGIAVEIDEQYDAGEKGTT